MKCSASSAGGAPTRLQKMAPRGMSDIRERLLWEGFSLDTKTTRLERDEIVARPLLGCRTGEDRNVTAPIIVEILNTPLARAKAILVDRDLPIEGIDRGIDEAIPALKARRLRWVLSRHDFFERSWPSVAHGYLTLPLHRSFPMGHFAQSSSASRFTAVGRFLRRERNCARAFSATKC